MAETQNPDVKEWIIATAASDHMTGDASRIIDPVPSNQVFHAISGDVTATAVGSVRLLVESRTGEHHRLVLSNVFLVPGLPRGLVSLQKLDFEFHWGGGSQTLRKIDIHGNVTTLIELSVKQGLPYFPIVQEMEVDSQAGASSMADEERSNIVEVDEVRNSCENPEPLMATTSVYIRAN